MPGGLLRKTRKRSRNSIFSSLQALFFILFNSVQFRNGLSKLYFDRTFTIKKPGENYEELKKQLPEQYQAQWWKLLPYAAIFLINLLTGRRAVEGLTSMKKDHFARLYD